MNWLLSSRLSRIVKSELIERTLSGQRWKSAVDLKCFPQMLLSLKNLVLVL